MSQGRILIAEDYDDNRELLRVMLEGAGYSVHETRNGHECVAAARADSFDLALIDLSMPMLDGWGALRELRADEQTRTLPCVAITALAAAPAGEDALAAGFDAYISKPYRAGALLDTVARLLTKRGDGAPEAKADD
jgi:two-component system, cell cycle response regulator DivK